MDIKNESGFTLLEMLLTLSLLVILFSIIFISINQVTDKNIALQIKSEANNALQVSRGYYLSTSNFRVSEVEDKLEHILDGYSQSTSAKRTFQVKSNVDTTGNKVHKIILNAVIDGGLELVVTININENKIVIQGKGDKDRIKSLQDNGVIE